MHVFVVVMENGKARHDATRCSSDASGRYSLPFLHFALLPLSSISVRCRDQGDSWSWYKDDVL